MIWRLHEEEVGSVSVLGGMHVRPSLFERGEDWMAGLAR